MLGEWGFRRLTLKTDARALVPRPETEIVVERCLALLEGAASPRVLDIGVGSGAIALALKDERPDAQVTGVDVSRDALSLARENAHALGLDVDLREGDVSAAAEGWDLVVSNPPYVDSLAGLAAGAPPRARARTDRRGHARADRPHGEHAVSRLRGRRRPGARRRRGAHGVRLQGVQVTQDLAGKDRSRRGPAVSDAVEALLAGKPVILPTDTVYGLCALAETAGPTERLYALKGRDSSQPSALLAADLDMLLAAVPELRGRAAAIAAALLPGPYTLVLPNPARRFPWLTGSSPEAIGVRVPALPEAAARVVTETGCVSSTSANLHRWTRPAAPRRGRAGAARSGRCHGRRGRAARHAVDGARLHGSRAARHPRGRRAGGRRARAGRAGTRLKIQCAGLAASRRCPRDAETTTDAAPDVAGGVARRDLEPVAARVVAAATGNGTARRTSRRRPCR